jgi:hypothetical protein
MVTCSPVGCRVHGRAVEQKSDPRRVATCARDWPRRAPDFPGCYEGSVGHSAERIGAVGKSLATMWQSAACGAMWNPAAAPREEGNPN